MNSKLTDDLKYRLIVALTSEPAGKEIAETIIAIIDELNTKASAVSPDLQGTPTAPTPPISDNSTRIATTEFVKNVMTFQVDGGRADSTYDATSSIDGGGA